MEKYLPQRNNTFHADGRNDRPIPKNTVLRGNDIHLKETFTPDYSDDRFSDDPQVIALIKGINTEGNPYQGFPIDVNEENMALGKDLFNRYCTVCHGAYGDGNGATKAFKMGNVASLHDTVRLSAYGKPEGSIFKVLTEGVAGGATGMVSFADRLSPKDRWAVILHIRVLQKMRVPQSEVQSLPVEVIQNITSLNSPDQPEADK
jgi:mono/diheme cytochrome c family protein